MKAPELQVSQWFNSEKDLKLADFSGKVLLIEAFQMLCPGCVQHGMPLAQSVPRTFAGDQFAVIGLHTVFEHHEAMMPVSLAAFLHEYKITFPVGVDEAGVGGLPKTMQASQMRGTPSLIRGFEAAAHRRGSAAVTSRAVRSEPPAARFLFRVGLITPAGVYHSFSKGIC